MGSKAVDIFKVWNMVYTKIAGVGVYRKQSTQIVRPAKQWNVAFKSLRAGSSRTQYIHQSY